MAPRRKQPEKLSIECITEVMKRSLPLADANVWDHVESDGVDAAVQRRVSFVKEMLELNPTGVFNKVGLRASMTSFFAFHQTILSQNVITNHAFGMKLMFSHVLKKSRDMASGARQQETIRRLASHLQEHLPKRRLLRKTSSNPEGVMPSPLPLAAASSTPAVSSSSGSRSIWEMYGLQQTAASSSGNPDIWTMYGMQQTGAMVIGDSEESRTSTESSRGESLQAPDSPFLRQEQEQQQLQAQQQQQQKQQKQHCHSPEQSGFSPIADMPFHYDHGKGCFTRVLPSGQSELGAAKVGECGFLLVQWPGQPWGETEVPELLSAAVSPEMLALLKKAKQPKGISKKPACAAKTPVCEQETGVVVDGQAAVVVEQQHQCPPASPAELPSTSNTERPAHLLLESECQAADGWRVRTCHRANGSTFKKYVSPTGKMFRTLKDASAAEPPFKGSSSCE